MWEKCWNQRLGGAWDCDWGVGRKGKLWHCPAEAWRADCMRMCFWKHLWKSHFSAWNLISLKINYRFFYTRAAYQISILSYFTDRKCSRLSNLCIIFFETQEAIWTYSKEIQFFDSMAVLSALDCLSQTFVVYLFFFSLYLSPDSCNIHITLTFILSWKLFLSYIHPLVSFFPCFLSHIFQSFKSPLWEVLQLLCYIDA